MKTLTNVINYEINREAINNDFYIVKFENENDFKKVNSKLLDNPDINIRSFSYSYGKYAYALMDKNAYDDLRCCDDLINVKYSTISVYDTYDDMLIRLFLNALSNYNQELAYNNLTGRFYKFIDNGGRKIKALDFKIVRCNNDILLKVSATSFKLEKKISYGEPAYVLSGNNKSLKRTFDVTEKNLYVKGNDQNTNTTSCFLNITNGSGRAKEVINLVELFNKNFSKYISINLKEIEINKKINPRNSKLQDETMLLIKDYKINLYSFITDTAYEDSVTDFINDLKQFELKITKTSRLHRDKLNIVLIYSKEYYEKHHLQDPHETLDKKCVHQCIIIDNLKDMFRIAKGKLEPSPQLITVFKELLIKNDIVKNTNSFSFDDWTKYRFQDIYTFIYKESDDKLYKMVVDPNGKYSIYEEHIDLFNAYENDKIKNIFVNNKNVKLIVIDDKSNINAIERTDIITLPHYQIFNKLPISKSKKVKDELYSGLCDINYYEINNEYYYNVGQALPNIQINIQWASHFYRAICVDQSRCIMTNILELMSVRFVKYNESTVLPYPIKYLREYIAINK